ncbi:MAG: nucleotidyltransferase family protein [Bacteriovorax sp.]
MNKKYPIEIQIDKIESFCQKWKVKEFALFGSILRDDFNLSKSDVDVLITFIHSQDLSLFDIVEMKEELEIIFKRKVDLVNRESIEKSKNPYRKKEILENCEVIYDKAA